MSSTYEPASTAGDMSTDEDVADRSLGSLVSSLTSDMSKLMRQELNLAKAELREEAKEAGKAAGMLGGAAFAGWMTALFLSVTLMWLLDKAMDLTLAALIVTLDLGHRGRRTRPQRQEEAAEHQPQARADNRLFERGCAMAQSPEELKREIEQTRQDMSRDVDAISDKVSPGRIVQRRVDRTKNAVGSVRERVMGSASSGTGTISDKASSVSDAVTGAPDAAMSRTQGNPLAAGVLAFAAGWLVASLLPASEAEQQAVLAVEDKVKEPVKEQLTGIAHEIKDDLQGPAQDAVQSVKESATDAAQAVKDQGAESAESRTRGDAGSDRRGAKLRRPEHVLSRPQN